MSKMALASGIFASIAAHSSNEERDGASGHLAWLHRFPILGKSLPSARTNRVVPNQRKRLTWLARDIARILCLSKLMCCHQGAESNADSSTIQ